MPRTAQQYEEIRSEKVKLIMDSALELFAKDGFHSTSISKIAEKANISKGLMYNYFSSKEDLLLAILKSVSEEILDMMNPDQDDVITQEEAENFFDLYFNMLQEKREHQMLIIQLSMQPMVSKFLMESDISVRAQKNQQLMFGFLANKSEDPTSAFMLINSVLKGFTMQYVFNPDAFTSEMIENFKNYLKQLLVK